MKFNTAIFYDVENLLKGYGFGQRIIQGLSLQDIFHKIQETKAIGKVAIQRAYANWSDPRLGFMKNDLLKLGIDPVQVFGFSYSGVKNVADIQLAVEVMDFVHTHPALEVFVIVSGDGGYASLARKLHEYGKTVIGCAYQKTSNKVLQAVCDEFVWIADPEEMDDEVVQIRITDNRALRLLEKIFPIDANFSQEQIWLKVAEVVHFFETASDYRTEIEQGINPSALRELLNGAIKGFDHARLGYSKFIEFLHKAFEKTSLCIYTNPSDVKIGYKDKKLAGYTVFNPGLAAQIPTYADLRATDPRIQRMQMKLTAITASRPNEAILQKIKEIIQWMISDAEMNQDIRAGINLSVFNEAIKVSIIGFDPIKFGFAKLKEFLQFAFKDTALALYSKPPDAVKVGFRNYPIPGYEILPDQNSRSIHCLETYQSVLLHGNPVFRLPKYETLKSVAIQVTSDSFKDLYFSEGFDKLTLALNGDFSSEEIKLAFSCFISAQCFSRIPEDARLSEQKLTLKPDFSTYDKMLDKLKVEMQKKIMFTLGDCKKEIFDKLLI
ncbi:MAG: NYN domain-containing protein [Bacteroidia bacterium]|nr:NYN domain-containing protein [Bacteroidia bacterium]MDW8159201.1 NYN domain-containing protein [Bacteroidia bacterium]